MAPMTRARPRRNGLNQNVENLVASFGTNVYWVFRFPVIAVRPTAEMLARKQLTMEDAQAMAKLPHVTAVSPQLRYQNFDLGFGNVAVKYKGRSVQHTILEGDTTAEPEVDTVNIPVGRFFSQYEQDKHSDVVVLGHDTADELFRGDDPLGKEVEIGGDMFRVIGVMEKRKTAFGGGKNPDDNAAYFPIGTFHKIHPEILDYWISVKYDSEANKQAVYDEIEQTLRIQRKVRFNQEDNFAIFAPDAITRIWNQLTGGIFIFMIGVASVGLMVGGVGVMNIMLVSVTERTREIGVRKAIGATKRTILLQFTIEAITLVRCGRIYWRDHRRRAYHGGAADFPDDSGLCFHFLGHHRLQRLLRHRPGFRYLPGMESGQSRSHRGAALRVSAVQTIAPAGI